MSDPEKIAQEDLIAPGEHVLPRFAARREWLTFVRRLARRRTALFGLVVVALVFAASLGAPWLGPWDPIEQDISNRLKPPGSHGPSGRVHVLATLTSNVSFNTARTIVSEDDRNISDLVAMQVGLGVGQHRGAHASSRGAREQGGRAAAGGLAAPGGAASTRTRRADSAATGTPRQRGVRG